ncbi:MAG: TerC family protein [Anaerolineae bacterium]|nr:TerC family protein [Gloeobacterales cyanobacterium ES-bin-313]
MGNFFMQRMGFNTGIEPWDIGIIFVLVFIEGALSADNAAVLAVLTRTLPTPAERKKALRYGIVGAFVFRFISVFFASWLIDNWPLKLVGAAYLIYLSLNHFLSHKSEDVQANLPFAGSPLFNATLGKLSPFWRVIILVELTDIAFSVDSITAAVAFSDKAWVVIAGGILGIIAMRYMAGQFIRLIVEYPRLETAAFASVGFVGIKMFVEVLFMAFGSEYEVPEWFVILMVVCIFAWGFSKKREEALDSEKFL